MVDIIIDPTDPEYQRMLANLDEIRTALSPRIALLLEPSQKQTDEWLDRDPLLRHAILLGQVLESMLDREVQE